MLVLREVGEISLLYRHWTEKQSSGQDSECRANNVVLTFLQRNAVRESRSKIKLAPR
jgi:hypothetical protein